MIDNMKINSLVDSLILCLPHGGSNKYEFFFTSPQRLGEFYSHPSVPKLVYSPIICIPVLTG